MAKKIPKKIEIEREDKNSICIRFFGIKKQAETVLEDMKKSFPCVRKHRTSILESENIAIQVKFKLTTPQINNIGQKMSEMYKIEFSPLVSLRSYKRKQKVDNISKLNQGKNIVGFYGCPITGYGFGWIYEGENETIHRKGGDDRY
jgi:hypothetical protein